MNMLMMYILRTSNREHFEGPIAFQFDRAQMYLDEFVKRMNKRIGGDWQKNECSLQSMTFDRRNKLTLEATCASGPAPPKTADMRNCNTLSLNYDSVQGTLTCGPPIVYVMDEMPVIEESVKQETKS